MSEIWNPWAEDWSTVSSRTSVHWKPNRESIQKGAGRTSRKPEVISPCTPSYSGDPLGHLATSPCLDGTFKVPGCLVSPGDGYSDISRIKKQPPFCSLGALEAGWVRI